MNPKNILLTLLFFVSVITYGQDVIVNRISEIESQLYHPYKSDGDKIKGYIVLKGTQRRSQVVKTFTLAFYDIDNGEVPVVNGNSVYCKLPFSEYSSYRSLFAERRRSRLSVTYDESEKYIKVVYQR